MSSTDDEKKELLAKLASICGSASNQTVAAIGILLVYQATKRAVEDGTLPESALTRIGFDNVLSWTAFGSNSDGVLAMFKCELYAELPIEPDPKEQLEAKKRLN